MTDNSILLIGYSADDVILHFRRWLEANKYSYKILCLEETYSTNIIQFYSSATGYYSCELINFENELYNCNGIFQRLTMPISELQFSNIYSISLHKVIYYYLVRYKSKIINHPLVGWENFSKPFQTTQLLRFGFQVPFSFSTTLPNMLERYSEKFSLIYKSNSGIRSIVNKVSESKSKDIFKLRNCPVFFQEYIKGCDVRIHVVNNSTFSIAIKSNEIDYRYDKSENLSFENISIPNEIRKKCIEYTKKNGLIFSGFDFKLTSDNRWVCLEMNPMPGFSTYDLHLDFTITKAIYSELMNS